MKKKCELKISVREDNGRKDSRTIVGTAIVFNVESCTLNESGTKFREVISPLAVTQNFIASQDIKLNLLHNRNDTIARCNKGVGNMNISVDKRGVNFEANLPKCDICDRALELVRNGVYSGCSFEFIPGEFDVVDRKNETVVIHTKIRCILAFTLAMEPAYNQTNVSIL